jgi:MoxR-like ATPase
LTTDEPNETPVVETTATMSIDEVRDTTSEIIHECNRIIVGKNDIILNVLVAMLANGHVILEGVPGLAKTYMARTFASILGCAFK